MRKSESRFLPSARPVCTNMFDVLMVQYIANEMRFYELVVFLEEHRSVYVHFILTGEPL